MAFRCVIVTPEQQVLDESLRQAILPAHDGLIGILTGRAPLLVKLGTGRLEIETAAGQRQSYYVDGGVAQMKDNNLTVVTDDAERSDQIDVEAARAEYAQAEALVATDELARRDRDRQMERARVKQQVAAAGK